jgi:hydrogenase maturation protease
MRADQGGRVTAGGRIVVMDRMPGRLVVHAIEAADLGRGTGLTPGVAAAVDAAARAVLEEIRDVPTEMTRRGDG